MTIQKQQTPATTHSSTEEALSGNPAAGNLAQKSAKLMEQIMGSVVTPKLSELPTTKERLLAVADAIEHQELMKKKIGFNMGHWHTKYNGEYDSRKNTLQGEEQKECGTVACIAGWTAMLDGHDDNRPDNENDIHGGINFQEGTMARHAMDVLGLDRHTAGRLFIPNPYLMKDATGPQAVAVIRHLANTGEVCWHKFDANGKERT